MTITTARLMDATDYEFTPKGNNTWEWTQYENEIGVRLESSEVDGTTLLSVISHETKGYVVLMDWQIEERLRIAIDVMQFAEHWDQQVWPFDELCEVLNAVDRDYGFTGSDLGLHIGVGFGMDLDKLDTGYRITDADGLDYCAGTAAGLAKLYPRVVAENVRRNIGWINRRIEKLSQIKK